MDEWTLKGMSEKKPSEIEAHIVKALNAGSYENAASLVSLLPPGSSLDEISLNFWLSAFTRLHQRDYPPSPEFKTFVKGLYKRYQNVRKVDELGCTILFDLSRQPGATRVNEVIADAVGTGVPVNQQCCFGMTAAITAVIHGNYAALEILARHKADLTLTDKNGRNVLHCFASTFASFKSRCANRDTPLICRILLLMKKCGVDMNAATSVGDSALILASSSPSLLNELLNWGLNVNHQSCSSKHWGMTALHCHLANSQCSPQHPFIIQRMLQYGAHTDIRDGKQRTPLVFAIRQHNLAAICTLVWANCFVNITYHDWCGDRDVMMDALLQYDFRIPEILIDAGYYQSCLRDILLSLKLVEQLYRTQKQSELIHEDDHRLRAFQQIFVVLPEHALHYIEQLVENPFSLSHMCRMCIRSSLGKGIDIGSKLKTLRLPAKLYSYVALEHLQEIF